MDNSAQSTITLDFTSVGPRSGGVGVVAQGIASGLLELGRDIRCIVSSGLENEWYEEAPELRPVLQPTSIALDASSNWQNQLRKVLPRNVLVQKMVGAVRAIRSRSSSRVLGDGPVWFPFHRVPVTSDRGIVTVHDLRVFEPDLASPMDQAIISNNIEKAAAIICSWPHPYSSLLQRFPAARDKLFLAPLPVLNPGPASERAQPRNGPRMLLPGFVTPHKNHQVVIRALPLIPGSTVVFTGSEDGSHGDQLRELAQSLGVSDRITWRGFVSAEELETEYAEADLLVMPTRWEAASGPVFEAIVRELPFVASNIGPIRSQLAVLGLQAETFSWDSPEELAIAVANTCNNYSTHLSAVRDVAVGLRDRTWADTANDYARVFDWVANGAAKPLDLMIGIQHDPGI